MRLRTNMLFSDLDLNKVYSYADYYSWKLEERVELIKGKVFKMSPAPNFMHQELVGRFYLQLANHLHGNSCKVMLSPFDVRFPRKTKNDQDIITVLQPDLCVVCDISKLDERGCLGAPDVVIEILSRATTKRDLKFKYEVYEEAGVKEYWVVSPGEQTLTIYTNIDGKFNPSRQYVSGDTVVSSVLSDLSLNMTAIFPDDEDAG